MILKVYLPGRMKLCLGRKDAGVLSGDSAATAGERGRK